MDRKNAAKTKTNVPKILSGFDPARSNGKGPSAGDEFDNMEAEELDDLPPCFPPHDGNGNGENGGAVLPPPPPLPYVVNPDNVIGFAVRLEDTLKEAKGIALSMLGSGFSTLTRHQQDAAYVTLKAIESAGSKAKRFGEMVKGGKNGAK
jgi:hypothetical protein